MKYFYIHPIDKLSHSRRWITDELGLEAIRFRYENYDKDPKNLVNRWNEFVVEETKEVVVDFGGMYCMSEPEVRIKDGDAFYSMQVTQLPMFAASLQKPQLSERYSGAAYIAMWRWNLCLSLETIQRILPLVVELEKNCEEMLEGVEKDWAERIEKINRDGGKIVSIRQEPPKDEDD